MLYWLVQSSLDMAAPTAAWLRPAERVHLDTLKTEKRRRDWLLGRWTAKRVLQVALEQEAGVYLPLAAITIESDHAGAPTVRWETGCEGWDFRLSISHAHDRAFCAAVTGGSFGADLELIEPRTTTFVDDYFTEAEQALVRRAPEAGRDCLVTAIWSGKEAALKAARVGLTVDTRTVDCRISPQAGLPGRWVPFDIGWDAKRLDRPAPTVGGWWRVVDRFVLTLACPPGEAPQPAPASIPLRRRVRSLA